MGVCEVRRRDGGARALRGLALVVALGPAACTAWDLAGRGVPDESLIETYTLEMPAVDIPVGSGHHGGPQPMPLQTTADFSGWVHGFSYEVVDAQGERLPDEVLHHVKVMAPDTRELFSDLMLRIVGAGSETEPVSLPKQAGYRVDTGDSLLVTAVTHNPTDADLHGVTIRVHLTYSPEGSWKEPLSVYPFFTHVTEPGAEETYYDIPPGRSERSFEVTPAVSGRILGFGGHLHKYGRSLQVMDVTSGDVLWEVEAVRDAEGNVLRVPTDDFVLSGGIPVEAGRSYRVTAVYENPGERTLSDGAMGTVGGVFFTEAAWPAADPDHPVYVWDVTRELAPLQGLQHRHADASPAEKEHAAEDNGAGQHQH